MIAAQAHTGNCLVLADVAHCRVKRQCNSAQIFIAIVVGNFFLRCLVDPSIRTNPEEGIPLARRHIGFASKTGAKIKRNLHSVHGSNNHLPATVVYDLALAG